ncbi:MAG: hypothetical protein ACPGMR_03195 [Pontibacterium sp.]
MLTITSTSYNVQANRSVVTVELSQRLTSSVIQLGGQYRVELEGEFNQANEDSQAQLEQVLEAAGVDVGFVLA